MLRLVSIGQYNQGLHFEDRLLYSSVGGGLLTLLLFIVFMAYSVTQIIALAKMTTFNVETSIEDVLRFSEFKDYVTHS